MDARAWRLAPAAGAAWACAIVSTVWSGAAVGIALVCGVGFLLCLLIVGRRRSRAAALVAVALAFAAASAGTVAAASEMRDTARAAGDGRRLEAELRITGKLQQTATGFRADALVQTARAGERMLPAGVPVTLLLPDALKGVAPGALVAIDGSAFAADAGERSVLVVRAERAELLAAPEGIAAASAWLRDRLGEAVIGLPQPGAGLVPGLAVGDTGGVSSALDQQMRDASLTHLTAVSGANCAIVVGLGFLLAAACRASRGVRVAAGLAALAGFVVLVTPEPSVVRAATMSAIAMCGLLLGRRGAGLAVLCLAVAVLLAVDPWLALSLGFALSAVATGALLVLAPPLARGLARVMPGGLALALAVPLSAQLVCGPLIVLISPGVAVYAVPANLLAAPAAPVATIVGLAACLAAPVPVLQAGLVALAWVPAAWIAGIAAAVQTLPVRLLPWPEGPGGAVALGLAGVVVVVLVRGRGTSRAGRILHVLATLCGVGGAAALAGSLVVATVVVPLTTPRDWVIAMCDVGQGDAVLLRSEGAVMLVDTGPEPELLATCLDRLGIARIDVLVLTHFDIDHVGGAAAVAGRVDLLLHGPPDAGDDARLTEIAPERVAPAEAGLAGTLGGAAWRVLWPASMRGPAGNDASVVVEIAGGGVPRSILLGDLSGAAQQLLRASGAVRGSFEVLKVSHHGSADQDAGLQRAISPSLALIGVGADNDYGHPRAEILDELMNLGATIGRTDTDGLLLVGYGDERLTLWRERQPAMSGALVRLRGWQLDDPPPFAARSRSSPGARRSLRRSC